MKYITGRVASFQDRTISLESGDALPADILVNACAALIPANSPLISLWVCVTVTAALHG